MTSQEQRLYSAIYGVILETRGFNERKQEAWCKVCRYKGGDRLHDPECSIYELHGAFEKWAPLARGVAQSAASVVAEEQPADLKSGAEGSAPALRELYLEIDRSRVDVIRRAEAIAKECRSWGVDEQRVDYGGPMGRSWLIVHLLDALRDRSPASAEGDPHRREKRKTIRAYPSRMRLGGRIYRARATGDDSTLDVNHMI